MSTVGAILGMVFFLVFGLGVGMMLTYHHMTKED